MRTFLTSFTQIGLVAINTYFITKLFFVGIFIISTIISLLWCYNVTKISVSTIKQKIIYSLGAGFGAVSGLVIVKYLF